MKNIEIVKSIVYEGSMTAVGGDFVDERVYDRRGRGYVPSPNIKLLLISDEELAQRIKEFQKKQKTD